ncbi:MAG: DUF6077 domain-containing protein [Clostridium sp.]|nr:DUF6077 domain-containing protein [Clostridium sp.]
MMGVYQIFSFILWLLAIPFCMGLLFLPLLNKSQRTPGTALIAGYILQFFTLELVGIPVVLLTVYRGFSTFIKCYTPVLVLCALGGIWLTYLKGKKGYKLNFKGFSRLKEYPLEGKIMFLLFLGLVGFQLYMAFTRASFDGDDAYYGVQAVIAQQKDTLYRINPYTGRSAPLDVRHALALFSIWEAYVGSMGNIHATVAAHSVIPLALIPLTYILYYQIGRILFKNKKELLPMFMALIALWQMFGAVSIYTVETFFLTRTWQGKSFAGNFVIPAVLWIFFSLFGQEREKGETLQLKEGWKIVETGRSLAGHVPELDTAGGQKGLWILLACLNLAGGASSSLAIFLSCLMTAGFGFLFALKEKKFSILVKAGLACIPGGAYVALYMALTHGILVL